MRENLNSLYEAIKGTFLNVILIAHASTRTNTNVIHFYLYNLF